MARHIPELWIQAIYLYKPYIYNQNYIESQGFLVGSTTKYKDVWCSHFGLKLYDYPNSTDFLAEECLDLRMGGLVLWILT